MRFSYSQVSMYESNPWKHFCNYVMGLYPPQSEQAERGTDVHALFEILAKLDKSTNYIEYIDNMHENKELEDNIWTIVRRYLINYAGIGNGLLAENRLPWKDAVKVECEKKVMTTLDGIEFIGFIDLVVYNEDGSVSLYDYKTLSNKPSIYKYTYGMQGNLYIKAMEQLGYEVREFVFDAMNPKMDIPWNGYRFFRIELDNNPIRVQNSVDRFVHLANEILKNPSYYNTFDGWNDDIHNDAWKALMRSPEHLYEFLVHNDINVEQRLTESVSKGYPVPHFFVVEGDEYSEQLESTENKIKIIKEPINNRKNLENWTDEEIRHDDLDFDYLILGNSKGWRQFTKNYDEVQLFTEDEINSLDFGENYKSIIKEK